MDDFAFQDIMSNCAIVLLKNQWGKDCKAPALLCSLHLHTFAVPSALPSARPGRPHVKYFNSRGKGASAEVGV